MRFLRFAGLFSFPFNLGLRFKTHLFVGDLLRGRFGCNSCLFRRHSLRFGQCDQACLFGSDLLRGSFSCNSCLFRRHSLRFGQCDQACLFGSDLLCGSFSCNPCLFDRHSLRLGQRSQACLLSGTGCGLLVDARQFGSSPLGFLFRRQSRLIIGLHSGQPLVNFDLLLVEYLD
ncbi:hypothetical protein BK665_10350 [Pseudomonas frederiksbergensis]|uniref:Uncharacterized protein n=1 Tax=Pseudomonas frederiksbergensis TaxID=104087 RepID=A0A423KLH8_9PSED|nr:hypothetical protein BK665_10350 [Pseudomonas frederiksbergensis]